jgi:hypothetical protein
VCCQPDDATKNFVTGNSTTAEKADCGTYSIPLSLEIVILERWASFGWSYAVQQLSPIQLYAENDLTFGLLHGFRMNQDFLPIR